MTEVTTDRQAKLVAAQSRNGSLPPDSGVAQAFGNGADGRVPCRMPVGIVDELEFIQVDQKNRGLCRWLLQTRNQLLVKHTPIEQAGQRIVAGQRFAERL